MKNIVVVVLSLFFVVAIPSRADECEGTWPADVAKSGDIDTLRAARAKAGGCVVKYASEAIAMLTLKKEIENELKNEPEDAALKRLNEIAGKEAVTRGKRALEFEQIQKIFNQLINIEIAKRLQERLQTPDVLI